MPAPGIIPPPAFAAAIAASTSDEVVSLARQDIHRNWVEDLIK